MTRSQVGGPVQLLNGVIQQFQKKVYATSGHRICLSFLLTCDSKCTESAQRDAPLLFVCKMGHATCSYNILK